MAIGATYECAGSKGGFLLWPVDHWPDRGPPDLEPEIKEVYDEARAILALSPRAAATLVRRCLQHLIRAKLGINEKRLYDEIEKAIKREELTKTTQGQLHHIREIGNWGAHPAEDASQSIIDVNHEEAAYTFEVLEMLFQDLYVAPAKAAQMKARIAKKKAGT